MGSLSCNLLAKQTKVYVFSDAASIEQDVIKVEQIRDIAKSYQDKFASLELVSRTENRGGTKNALDGLTYLLNKYGKAIFLEDDIETAPGFLSFINEGLSYYQNDDRILSISGYTPPLSVLNSDFGDYYINPRFNGWGAGMWKRSMDITPSKLSEIKDLNLKKIKPLLDQGGEDIYFMARSEENGDIDAQDVRNMVFMAIHGLYTVYPRVSLVQNTGLDGSGFHCGSTKKFNHKVLWSKTSEFVFEQNPQINKKILKENRKFRSTGHIRRKLTEFLKRIGLYPIFKYLKNKFS
jgi:hypothetical protein